MKSEKMKDRDFEKAGEALEPVEIAQPGEPVEVEKPEVEKPEMAKPETIYLSEKVKETMVECEQIAAMQSKRRMEAVNNYLDGYIAAKGYVPQKTAARLNDDYTVTLEFLP